MARPMAIYEFLRSWDFTGASVYFAPNDDMEELLVLAMRESERFDVSPAFATFWESGEEKRDGLWLGCPNVIPPFRATWLEWTTDAVFGAHGGRWAMVFHRIELREDRPPNPSQPVRAFLQEIEKRSHGRNPRWSIAFSVFRASSEGELLRGTGGGDYLADADGSAIGEPFLWGSNGNDQESAGEINARLLLLPIPFAAFCFSLMACENVEYREFERSSTRAERRRGENPGVRFKRLIVHSVNQRKRYKPSDDPQHADLPLHICRGHFKDYRNGAGLFGKYKGLYWWDEHARGDEEHGVVVKDYEVRP